jgi:hypothetical protein
MTATIRDAKMDSSFIFLAATNTLEKLEKIPPAFWAKVGLAVAGVIIVVIVLRKLFSINKFVLFGAIFIGGGIYFFNMVYHRTEPKFLTPMVERIAQFFPTAGAYETTQSKTPDQTKR